MSNSLNVIGKLLWEVLRENGIEAAGFVKYLLMYVRSSSVNLCAFNT